MIDYDKKIHDSRNAKDWAELFMEVYRLKKPNIDEDFMLGWFANAMMAMYDSIFRNEIKEIKLKIEQYESGYKGACPTCELVGEINIELEQKLAKAVEGLKFYADKDSWVDFSIRNDFFTGLDLIDQRDLFYKGGKRARQILKEIGELWEII